MISVKNYEDFLSHLSKANGDDKLVVVYYLSDQGHLCGDTTDFLAQQARDNRNVAFLKIQTENLGYADRGRILKKINDDAEPSHVPLIVFQVNDIVLRRLDGFDQRQFADALKELTTATVKVDNLAYYEYRVAKAKERNRFVVIYYVAEQAVRCREMTAVVEKQAATYRDIIVFLRIERGNSDLNCYNIYSRFKNDKEINVVPTFIYRINDIELFRFDGTDENKLVSTLKNLTSALPKVHIYDYFMHKVNVAVKSEKLLVVYFVKKSNAKCQKMSPLVEKVANENRDVMFVEVDLESDKEPTFSDKILSFVNKGKKLHYVPRYSFRKGETELYQFYHANVDTYKDEMTLRDCVADFKKHYYSNLT